MAFATVSDSLGAGGLRRRSVASELDFDYDSSFRTFVGYQCDNCTDVKFTYWFLDADTAVEGTAGAGQTIVDPFGNLGTAGTRIATSASVQMNVFDFDYAKHLNFTSHNLGLRYFAGIRFADIEQFYDSRITDASGGLDSLGTFTANFQGVGPHFGLDARTYHGACRQFGLLGTIGGALLIGDYEVASGVTIPGMADGGQSAGRTRAVPVLDTEFGVIWTPNDRIKLTAGWLFQAWFNAGTSGGTFDGENLPLAPIDTAFGGADDADIMSFDGLFVRAEIDF